MANETKQQLIDRVLGNVDDRLATAAYQARSLAERLEDMGERIQFGVESLPSLLRTARMIADDAAVALDSCPMCHGVNCSCAADYHPNYEWIVRAA